MKYFGISDVGLVRKINQDCYSITTNKAQDTLAIVCDGVGGGRSGDIASKAAASFLSDRFNNCEAFSDDRQIREWLNKTITEVNAFVVSLALSKRKYEGMSTTLVAALFCKLGTYVVNVGDSRAYYLSDEQLIKITKDHTLVETLVDQGLIKPEDALKHPHRHVLINAIGIESEIKIDIFRLSEPYELLMLCSDGLHGYLSDDEIQTHINIKQDIEHITQNLVDQANQKGGMDNVTIVLVEVAGHE